MLLDSTLFVQTSGAVEAKKFPHPPIPLPFLQLQKRVVIWEKRALKSFVAVPVPSGFEARSNALNFASSYCNACSQNLYRLESVTKTRNIMSVYNIWQKITQTHRSRKNIEHNNKQMNTCKHTSATSALAMVLVSV